MTFARPWLLLLLLGLARLVVAPAPRRRAGGAVQRRVDSRRRQRAALVGRAAAGAPRPEHSRRWILAAAGPRVGGDTVEVKQEGIAIVITIDISSSMLAEDFAPSNRLAVAQAPGGRVHPRAARPTASGWWRSRARR